MIRQFFTLCIIAVTVYHGLRQEDRRKARELKLYPRSPNKNNPLMMKKLLVRNYGEQGYKLLDQPYKIEELIAKGELQ